MRREWTGVPRNEQKCDYSAGKTNKSAKELSLHSEHYFLNTRHCNAAVMIWEETTQLCWNVLKNNEPMQGLLKNQTKQKEAAGLEVLINTDETFHFYPVDAFV